MGEDPGNVSAVEDLRRDIDQTRADLGETAAALGAKADVKGRAAKAGQVFRRGTTGTSSALKTTSMRMARIGRR